MINKILILGLILVLINGCINIEPKTQENDSVKNISIQTSNISEILEENNSKVVQVYYITKQEAKEIKSILDVADAPNTMIDNLKFKYKYVYNPYHTNDKTAKDIILEIDSIISSNYEFILFYKERFFNLEPLIPKKGLECDKLIDSEFYTKCVDEYNKMITEYVQLYNNFTFELINLSTETISNETISNISPTTTLTSNKTYVTTYDYKKYTYEDDEGNIHQVEDYTSQGGSVIDSISIPVDTNDIMEPVILHNITINVTHYKDHVIIKRVLNNTNKEILKYISSINVFNSNFVKCGNKTESMIISVGCTEPIFNDNIFTSAKISVISNRNGIVQDGIKDVCSSLEFVLNHEIGHVKGLSILEEDISEFYADKYAQEHTKTWKNIYDC